MTTPVCPNCGSVRVASAGGADASRHRAMRCEEPDCGFTGRRPVFLRGGPNTWQKTAPNYPLA